MKNRPERRISFLVVWLTMFSFLTGWGQNPYGKKLKLDFLHLHYPGMPEVDLYPGSPVFEGLMLIDIPPMNARSAISGDLKRNPSAGLNWQMTALYMQPPNLYYTQSGYFCKREWEFEKSTHIPLRFRLGSLADCNALEGKH